MVSRYAPTLPIPYPSASNSAQPAAAGAPLGEERQQHPARAEADHRQADDHEGEMIELGNGEEAGQVDFEEQRRRGERQEPRAHLGRGHPLEGTARSGHQYLQVQRTSESALHLKIGAYNWPQSLMEIFFEVRPLCDPSASTARTPPSPRSPCQRPRACRRASRS